MTLRARSSAVTERPRDVSCLWIFLEVAQDHSVPFEMTPWVKGVSPIQWNHIRVSDWYQFRWPWTTIAPNFTVYRFLPEHQSEWSQTLIVSSKKISPGLWISALCRPCICLHRWFVEGTLRAWNHDFADLWQALLQWREKKSLWFNRSV